jgi:hypothetical protein
LVTGEEKSDWTEDVDERITFGVDFGKKAGFIQGQF